MDLWPSQRRRKARLEHLRLPRSRAWPQPKGDASDSPDRPAAAGHQPSRAATSAYGRDDGLEGVVGELESVVVDGVGGGVLDDPGEADGRIRAASSICGAEAAGVSHDVTQRPANRGKR